MIAPGGKIKVLAGTGGNSTTEAVYLTKAAADAGADGSLQVAPYYNKPTQEGLFQHFKAIADSISADRIATILQKLEGFGTRYVLSAQDDPVHGIGAAKQWIHDQMQSYSPRLQVSYQSFTLKKRAGSVLRDVDLSNVVAVLPGTIIYFERSSVGSIKTRMRPSPLICSGSMRFPLG